MDKRTLLIVTASTAIGFIGDAVIYSLGESKGKPFKLVMPKGMELVKLLAMGAIGGFILDAAVKGIERSIMSEPEKVLADLYEQERKLILQGQRTGVPNAVTYKPTLTGMHSNSNPIHFLSGAL